MQSLQTSAQFQAVMQGNIVGRTPHFVLHALHWQPAPATEEGVGLVAPVQRPLFAPGRHCGVLVPKRWARRAVTRSTIKRQMRAVAAAHVAQIPEQTALVIRLRSEFDRKRFISATSDALRVAVSTELQQLFARVAWQELRPLPRVPLHTAGARARTAASDAAGAPGHAASAPAAASAPNPPATTPSGTMRAAP